MNKTFEVKLVITIPEDSVDSEEFIEFKTAILNGEMKRDLMGGKLGIVKSTITLKEIKSL
jgi:hypothetical protein